MKNGSFFPHILPGKPRFWSYPKSDKNLIQGADNELDKKED